jgi:hypothetical protein
MFDTLPMTEYLKNIGFWDETDDEINEFFQSDEGQKAIKNMDWDWFWRNLYYRLERGKDFQILYYDAMKYIKFQYNFIQYLKKNKLRKGFKKLPKDFYNSYEWAEARIIILKRDDFKCRHCGNLANHVDHINSARYYPELALDPNNLISSCEDCHKNRQRRGFKNRNEV